MGLILEIDNARVIETIPEVEPEIPGDGFPSLIYESFEGLVTPPPRGYKQILEVFGDPNPNKNLIGSGYTADPKWGSKHCLTISESQLAGYNKRIWMNKVVAPPFKEALRRLSLALEETGRKYTLNSIGCYNQRFKRFNPEMGLSVHAFAAAFDINPATNKSFNRPEGLEEFANGWREYSDMPEVLVRIFENLGFTWGGRWGKGKDRFCDPMHFQYCSGY
jgi:hypothetical protein